MAAHFLIHSSISSSSQAVATFPILLLCGKRPSRIMRQMVVLPRGTRCRSSLNLRYRISQDLPIAWSVGQRARLKEAERCFTQCASTSKSQERRPYRGKFPVTSWSSASRVLASQHKSLKQAKNLPERFCDGHFFKGHGGAGGSRAARPRRQKHRISLSLNTRSGCKGSGFPVPAIWIGMTNSNN